MSSCRAPLVGVEPEEVARVRLHRLVAGIHLRVAVDDEDEGGLLYLVLAELLPGRQGDEHDASLAVARVEHGRRA